MAVGLAALSGQVQAQNVSVYGIIDVGVEAINHVGPTSGTVTQLSWAHPSAHAWDSEDRKIWAVA